MLQPPLELGDMWLPWSTIEGDLMCTPWPYVNDECLSEGRGILPWEYDHMRSQQYSDSDSHTSTIHAVQDGHADDDAEEVHFMLARHIVEIDAATEAKTLQPLQDRLILLLDNPVHVVFTDNMAKQNQGYSRFWQECTVLDTTAYTAIFDFDGNRAGRSNAKPMADRRLPHQPARLRRGRLHRRNHALIKI